MFESRFTTISGAEITPEQLSECAALFSDHYGVWGKAAQTLSPFLKSGTPVKLNPIRLRRECIVNPEDTVLVTCTFNDKLVGHAFACTWKRPDGTTIGWVTQLVVDRLWRRRYIATTLLQQLKESPAFRDVTVVGLVSSHPAACNALAKLGGARIDALDTSFIATNAPSVFASTPADYLKTATLHGSLFQTEASLSPSPGSTASGVVSSAFTEFFVSHVEPLEVLAAYKEQGKWCLGELLEGHEFLILVPFASPLAAHGGDAS